ncbi:hypothetical protein K503DRAFT_765590 [Rhizopogon vinicolor AM-OR11-026]|uniref:Secreted protein n=1 Tax=Rhizopogon vinicolor AM-OR11-026 TaxID=1314800 RepID=A0A1B7NFY1_9AGAM|nr:hypothetical protein K503DRAFT_765590 [Rhizopogon vinicolor AM-OR11-026]
MSLCMILTSPLLLYAVCSDPWARVIHYHRISFPGLILHEFWVFQYEVFVLLLTTKGARHRVFRHPRETANSCNKAQQGTASEMNSCHAQQQARRPKMRSQQSDMDVLLNKSW